MANDYFTPSGAPATGSQGSSSVIRGEYNALAAAFDKLPALTANGDLPVFVNASGTALVPVAAAAARTLLGSTAVGDALFIAATVAAARATLGSGATGDALFLAATAAAARATLGSTAVGDALFITASAAAARVTLGSTTVGDALFITASAATARATLAAAGLTVANTFTQNQTIAKTTPILILNDTSGIGQSSLTLQDNGVANWRIESRQDSADELIIVNRAATTQLSILQSGAATYTGAFNVVGALTDDGVPVATTTDAQTLTNKTLTAPVLSGTATGTYTLGGTPTITAPTINGGTISGITDLAVADGGTGASTAAAARANLGTPEPLLIYDRTLTEVRNTATKTLLKRLVIPANSLGTDAVLEFVYLLDVENSSGVNRIIIYNIDVGAVNFATTGINYSNHTDFLPLHISGSIAAKGVTNSQYFEVQHKAVTNLITQGQMGAFLDQRGFRLTGLDMTSAQNIDLSITLPVALTTVAVRSHAAYVRVRD